MKGLVIPRAQNVLKIIWTSTRNSRLNRLFFASLPRLSGLSLYSVLSCSFCMYFISPVRSLPFLRFTCCLLPYFQFCSAIEASPETYGLEVAPEARAGTQSEKRSIRHKVSKP